MPRKIAANLLFTFNGPPIKNGYLVIDESGLIEKVVDTSGQIPEIANLEYYNGILVPGFIIFAQNQTLDNIPKYLWDIGVQALMFPPYTKKTQPLGMLQSFEINLNDGLDFYKDSASVLTQIIQKQSETVGFIDALMHATSAPAKLLGCENQLGRFVSGSRPGVILLSPFDFRNNRITEQTVAKRIV